MAHWDSSENWYSACVGEKGHYYHQAVVLPNAIRLLGKFTSLLDLGCGQGVLSRHISKDAEYVGVDQSKELIAAAKKMSKHGKFVVADATEDLPIDETDFERAAFILSLQNMENGKGAIAAASKKLAKNGKLLLVLNHPCFRIPRQSGWGVEEAKKLQYRRIDSYMSAQKIPIQTHPGKKEESQLTYSYHHPLADISAWLKGAGLRIEIIEEWCSDKKSEGSKAKMEDRARKEIPLFMAIVGVK